MAANSTYTHYRLVNLEPGQLDFILCVNMPDDGAVHMSATHDSVSCPNCREENIRTAIKFYNSLINARA